MDVSSQQVVLLLNAFATIVDRLQSFGYALYLDTQASSWIQPRAVTVSGEGFQIFQNSQTLRFDRALLTGCALQYDTAATHWLTFSILFAWNAEHWFIQSTVEEEDSIHDPMRTVLWESPAYRASTIDEAIHHLQHALEALIESKMDERIATALATIKQR